MSRKTMIRALFAASLILIAWAMHSVDAITFLKRLHGR